MCISIPFMSKEVSASNDRIFGSIVQLRDTRLYRGQLHDHPSSVRLQKG